MDSEYLSAPSTASHLNVTLPSPGVAVTAGVTGCVMESIAIKLSPKGTCAAVTYVATLSHRPSHGKCVMFSGTNCLPTFSTILASVHLEITSKGTDEESKVCSNATVSPVSSTTRPVGPGAPTHKSASEDTAAVLSSAHGETGA